MNGYDRNMRKLGETSSAAEMFLESKEQKAARQHAAQRARLERNLIHLAKAAQTLAASIENLEGSDRMVLDMAVSTAARTFDEMIRTYNVLSETYQTEANNADK